MSLMDFQQEVENKIGRKLRLRINDNHSTMLSVKWEPDCTRVSMHKMFLQAPQNIMEELSCYIGKKNQPLPTAIKSFIEESLKQLDYSNRVDPRSLVIQGNVYNLKEIYDKVNREYFDDELDLHITWFGKPRIKKRTKIVFGLYCDSLRLIKIHRILDNPNFPDYLVSFIVYHEMLHHVCPAYVDEKGIRRMHDKEFKKRESQFRYYELANNWIKKNQPSLFIN